MNIEDKIKALETQLEELKAEWEKQSTSEEWPKVEDYFYCINENGHLQEYTFNDDTFDNGCKSLGNIFRTEEEAQAEIEARKVVAELRMTDGRVDVYTERGSDFYGFDIHESFMEISEECFDFFLAWDSYEAVKKAIEKVGEDRILAATKHFARV